MISTGTLAGDVVTLRPPVAPIVVAVVVAVIIALVLARGGADGAEDLSSWPMKSK